MFQNPNSNNVKSYNTNPNLVTYSQNTYNATDVKDNYNTKAVNNFLINTKNNTEQEKIIKRNQSLE